MIKHFVFEWWLWWSETMELHRNENRERNLGYVNLASVSIDWCWLSEISWFVSVMEWKGCTSMIESKLTGKSWIENSVESEFLNVHVKSILTICFIVHSWRFSSIPMMMGPQSPQNWASIHRLHGNVFRSHLTFFAIRAPLDKLTAIDTFHTPSFSIARSMTLSIKSTGLPNPLLSSLVNCLLKSL